MLDIIRQSPLMSNEFKARARERFNKLLPVELDPSLTIEQKIPAVIASFQESFADLVSTKKLSRKNLAQLIANADENFQLRLLYKMDIYFLFLLRNVPFKTETIAI